MKRAVGCAIVWFALVACSASTEVPIPEPGTEVGNIVLENGNRVAEGRVEKVDGTRVLIHHTWDGSEDWVDWRKVKSVEK